MSIGEEDKRRVIDFFRIPTKTAELSNPPATNSTDIDQLFYAYTDIDTEIKRRYIDGDLGLFAFVSRPSSELETRFLLSDTRTDSESASDTSTTLPRIYTGKPREKKVDFVDVPVTMIADEATVSGYAARVPDHSSNRAMTSMLGRLAAEQNQFSAPPSPLSAGDAAMSSKPVAIDRAEEKLTRAYEAIATPNGSYEDVKDQLGRIKRDQLASNAYALYALDYSAMREREAKK